MNKHLVALALVATASPLLVVTTSSPVAAAGVCDGVYPPGLAYGLRRSPVYAQVESGASLEISTRLVRGDKECNGERVGFYTRGKGGKFFTLSRTADVDGRGRSAQDYVVRGDFRWYTDFVNDGTQYRSAPALVQIRTEADDA